MTVRTYIANTLIDYGRAIGRSADSELAVEVSDHSIEIGMEQPDETQRAWDANLYRRGCLFLSGYANPIKPRVRHHDDLENPDEAFIDESTAGDAEATDGDESEAETDDSPHVSLIASSRYKDYMRQDLISQLLNPRAQWRLIAYAVIALTILMFINVFISLAAAGVL
jgi:hypothetical protein